jgi:hypothetical protein
MYGLSHLTTYASVQLIAYGYNYNYNYTYNVFLGEIKSDAQNVLNIISRSTKLSPPGQKVPHTGIPLIIVLRNPQLEFPDSTFSILSLKSDVTE